jgi:hypothetical protein
LIKRFSAGLENPRAKAHLWRMNRFSAGLKSSSPLLKQEAPTKPHLSKLVDIAPIYLYYEYFHFISLGCVSIVIVVIEDTLCFQRKELRLQP